jgi:DNA mismatch repair protein MutL
MTTHGHIVQKIMFEEIVTFNPGEAAVFEEILDDVTKLGFELTNIGGGSYSVSGVPSNIQNINVDEVLHELVYSAMDKTGNMNEEAREAMAFTMAKSFAIGYGEVLSQTEMTNLLRDLFSLSTPARTPDGKIVFSIVENKAIDKLF